MLVPLLAAVACGPAVVNHPASAEGAGPDSGTPTVVEPPGPAEPTALDRAAAAYAAADLDGAAAASSEVLAAPPDPSSADTARLLLARVELARGRWDEARALLAAVAGPDAKYVPGYDELAGLLAADADGSLADAAEDDQRAAAAALDGLLLVPGDRLLAALRLDLQLRLDAALGMRESLVRHAAAFLPLADPAAARGWTTEAESILQDPSALTETETAGLYAVIPADSPLWPAAARRWAEAALAAGDLETATAALDRLAATGAAERWLGELRDRIAAVADVDAGRIGVLLPTTGPSAAVGQRALAAMELALQPYGERFVLEARDTGGDEATTRAAVRSLVEESRAVALLGPVEARVAQAAAEEASALGIPLISLNVQRDVADAAGCRFRDFPTYAAEVEALIAYAWDHARGQRFVVLRAEGRYGELVAQAVADAVERRGGELVDIAPYAADQTEFIDLAREVRRARPDVVVFADSAARVALVAPALAFEDLWPQPAPHDPASPAPGGPRREALYLLPSAAADPAALEEARRYVDGAVAAVGFVAADAPERRSAFESAFRRRYPSGPSQLDAFAHDAASIAATLIDGGATNRPALCRALDAVESADTVAPFAGFGPDGEARRPVRIVFFRNGIPVPVEELPGASPNES
jgi:ABC-type branched-subunit amino acid transport system substrate-binding protein